MENNRVNMLQQISVVSLYLDDLRLFLDTHPDNTQALTMYDEFAASRKELVDKYVVAFGPLTFYDINCSDMWRWVEHPWPWEGVC